jgi:sulfite oxidase
MGAWGKREDMIVYEAEPYNAESARGALASRLITPVDSFYSRNHGAVPRIDPAGWRLRISGLVQRDLELSLADLRRFTPRTLTVTLQCAGNRRADLIRVRDIPGEAPWGPGAISTAEWTGASLAEVLRTAGPRPGASHVAFCASDIAPEADPPQPFGGSVPLRKAQADEVLLAWAMNGQPLPPLHGGPVRVVVPGYIGARSIKWIEQITVQDHPSENYFQATAYRLLPADADPRTTGPGAGLALSVLAVNADILCPGDGAALAPGRADVTGYAVSGDGRGVARVDVSTDGGQTWRQADLGDNAGPWAWRHWHTVIDVPPGQTEIIARAWDTAAAVQPESPAQLWNPKGYANNSWARIHVTARYPDASR